MAFAEKNNARVRHPSRAQNSAELRPKAGSQSARWLDRYRVEAAAWRPAVIEDEPGSTAAAPEIEIWAPESDFRGKTSDNEAVAVEATRVERIARSELRRGQLLDISFALQPTPIESLRTDAGPPTRAAAEVSTVLPLPNPRD